MRNIFFHISYAVLVCLSVSAWGQVSSQLGRFEVDYAKGCAPLTVTVTDITGGPTAQYLYDADTCVMSSPKYTPALCPPSNTTTNTTFTYTQPGTYSLVQVVASMIPRGDTLVIEVLPPEPPEFNVLLCNNYGVYVDITDTRYDQFEIDYGDGSPPTSAVSHSYPAGNLSYNISVSGYYNNGPVNCGDSTVTITPTNTMPAASLLQVTVINQGPNTGQVQLDYTLNPDIEYVIQTSVNGTSNFINGRPLTGDSLVIKNLNTTDSVYCFRIAAADKCTRTKTSFSNTICTTSITVQAQEGQNQINWNTFGTPEFLQYEVFKNNTPVGPPINSANITGITDTSVECNVLYCYQIITTYNDGSRSLSIPRCVTGINNLPPSPISSLTASVDGNSITLDWVPESPINFYRVFRSENNGPFEAIGEGSSLPYVDVNLRPQLNTYCYYVIYQNTCGRQSTASTTACPMKLDGDNPDNRNFVLSWTPYLGWEWGVFEYQVEIMDESGVPVGPPVSLSPGTTGYLDPITKNRQISQYRIAAIPLDTIPFVSYSNIIKLDIPLQIFVPNSFTPNNDGLNDTFNAKGLFIETYSMEIYNRWGELLYHTENLEQGWSGYYKGSLIQEGTYVYKITATDPVGRLATKRGTIHLLRK